MKDYNALFNRVFLPIKLLIPQPVIAKIPGFTTNEEIRIKEVLKFIDPQFRCLDIGCGFNKLIREHKKRGGKGVGVDVYPWKGVDKVVKDTSKLTYDNKSFDCITFVACINHIPNREEVLKEARRILKDDGIIIFTYLKPLISAIWHKLAFWDWDTHERGMKEGEVFGFEEEEIYDLIRKTGYRIVESNKFSWGLNNIVIMEKK